MEFLLALLVAATIATAFLTLSSVVIDGYIDGKFHVRHATSREWYSNAWPWPLAFLYDAAFLAGMRREAGGHRRRMRREARVERNRKRFEGQQ